MGGNGDIWPLGQTDSFPKKQPQSQQIATASFSSLRPSVCSNQSGRGKRKTLHDASYSTKTTQEPGNGIRNIRGGGGGESTAAVYRKRNRNPTNHLSLDPTTTRDLKQHRSNRSRGILQAYMGAGQIRSWGTFLGATGKQGGGRAPVRKRKSLSLITQ